MIAYKIQTTIITAFQDFGREILSHMGQNPSVVELPVTVSSRIEVYWKSLETF